MTNSEEVTIIEESHHLSDPEYLEAFNSAKKSLENVSTSGFKLIEDIESFLKAEHISTYDKLNILITKFNASQEEIKSFNDFGMMSYIAQDNKGVCATKGTTRSLEESLTNMQKAISNLSHLKTKITTTTSVKKILD